MCSDVITRNKCFPMGLLCGSYGKESACNAGDQLRSLGQEDPLEKGTATHSSILAWRIPWTEEPSGLQSMGSQRVRHNCTTNTTTKCVPKKMCAFLKAYLLKEFFEFLRVYLKIVKLVNIS